MNSIDLNNHKITYDLKKSKRKSLGITVTPKGQLVITAPEFVSLEKIEELLQKRKDWILEKIGEKEKNLQIQPARKFVSGEALYLFGRQYYLKIERSNDYYVEKNNRYLTFYIRDLSEAPKVISNWLENEFTELVNVKSKECLEKFIAKSGHNLEPVFKIRKMTKRWGSCTSDGIIHLNPMLVAASEECIEYVIFHELVHLLHDIHDELFFSALKNICPKYKELKQILDKETVIYTG